MDIRITDLGQGGVSNANGDGLVVRVSSWVSVMREGYLDGVGGRGGQREGGRAGENGGDVGRY